MYQKRLVASRKKPLEIITNNKASKVHIIFDRYCSPSIKDDERFMKGRQYDDREYVISGPQQIRGTDFSKELRNDKFKTALVIFLISHWATNEMAPFIRNKKVFLNHIYCYMYEVDENENVIKTVTHLFSCPSHEEADTKIVFHITNIDYNANVTIKCSDTDILTIILANMHKMRSKLNIWL